MLPRLHVVTSDALLARASFEHDARLVLEAGGAHVALHVRGRATPAVRLLAIVTALRPAATATGAVLLVNDRIDVARAGGAHGVQLGIGSLPVPDARRVLGAGRIGYSAHGTEEAGSAVRAGADFIVLGTIWPTASHPGRPAAGVALVEATARSVTAPVIGIGGVTPARVTELAASGAYGAAVLGGVWDAPAPAAALAAYVDAVTGAYERSAQKELNG